MNLVKRKMYCEKYRKARNRVNRRKLGVFPMVDVQGIFSIYLMHKDLRTLQHLCDKILKCPRYYIHKKYNFFYVKVMDFVADRWITYMKGNNWKKKF